MHSHAATPSFARIAQLGGISFGIAPGWLVGQLLGLTLFTAIVYASVAGHLGTLLSPLPAVAVGLLLMLALDLTVLVHEAGHAVAAHVAGIRVKAIVLMTYGAATVREAGHSENANSAIAAAGPLANLAAGGLCAALVLATQGSYGDVLLVVGAFQAITALTNLVPLGKLDGARVFARWGLNIA
jgi:Zn-dependent protease